VTPVRRFPFGHEPAPTHAPRVESAPVAERMTMPMDDNAPRRPALPFRPPSRSADPSLRHEAVSVWRRRARIAFILLGLLLYVVAISIIVAPISWGP
jgi:hypothetical protein